MFDAQMMLHKLNNCDDVKAAQQLNVGIEVLESKDFNKIGDDDFMG